LKRFQKYTHFLIFFYVSIVDNLPLTILEAISSGNLVISFNNGGASEVVSNTGFVYEFNEITKLINKIKRIKFNLIKQKSKIARNFALNNFNGTKIEIKYKQILKQVQNYSN